MAGTVLPTSLSHYYKAGTEPLRALTELAVDEALAAAMGLRALDTVAFARFSDAERYLRDRRRTEAQMRATFEEAGGRPQRTAPLYFVLGRAEGFFERHESDLMRAEIRLADLPADAVSFTYGDSGVNAAIAAGTWPFPRPERQPWHGRVLTLAALRGLVDEIGLPPPWRPGQDHYVEAQVWLDPDPAVVAHERVT